MNIQNPQRAQAVRRDAPVKCAQCGRQVERRSRQQRYCSDDAVRGITNRAETALERLSWVVVPARPTHP